MGLSNSRQSSVSQSFRANPSPPCPLIHMTCHHLLLPPRTVLRSVLTLFRPQPPKRSNLVDPTCPRGSRPLWRVSVGGRAGWKKSGPVCEDPESLKGLKPNCASSSRLKNDRLSFTHRDVSSERIDQLLLVNSWLLFLWFY